MQLIEKDKKTRTAIVCPIVKTENKFFSLDDLKNKEKEAEGLVVAIAASAYSYCAVAVRACEACMDRNLLYLAVEILA